MTSVSNLDAWQQHEEEFHDTWAESIDINELLVDESFEYVTALENRFAMELMGDIRGKKVLDLGCGAGETSVYFAKRGAHVTAVDISAGMLKVAEQLAQKHRVFIETRKMVAEDLKFESDTFDYVFCNGVLHHVKLEPSLEEIKRVLKPGGIGVFIEPLSYNPVINIYRRIAQTVRTETETPFRFSQFKVFNKYFKKTNHREFWFTTLGYFLYFYLIERSDPAKERYWKKIIKDGPKLKKFTFWNRLDEQLLKIPFLHRMCWNTVIWVKK